MIKETRALGEEVLQSRTDLLARFMMLTDDEGHRLSDKYLRDVVLNFLIAGRDTTAQLLTWTFFLLSEVRQRRSCCFGGVAPLCALGLAVGRSVTCSPWLVNGEASSTHPCLAGIPALLTCFRL